ncbi:citrate/2-methylcitrate synthase [Ornithinibacillus contaminans]|uniref:citrate/2-methylcitrate synthase n=1 Tax=Ornithinibacillus contaminans TaxID=694055 RepID=UPI00064DF654|nr:citrate/2-methylcitrate synthase [Ornithinibacillus contaminans]
MFQPGLKGVTAVETKLSHIDGQRGVLTYRGIPVQELVNSYTFEEVAYFLLYERFPTQTEITAFETALKKSRYLPAYKLTILEQLPDEMELMDVLRTIVSASLPNEDDTKTAIQLIAIIPIIIAYRYRKQTKMPIIEPNSALNHVENFLYMINEDHNSTHAKILETYMILTMEHSLNASTFAARVTISTKSDLIAAITSALGAMKGPLHGGAPSGVIELLEEIKTEDTISEIIHKKLENKERIMGFGHRVYKTTDPRAEALKMTIMKLDNLPDWMSLAIKTEQETIKILKENKPNYQLYTNVEYYAAAIMKTLELDPKLFTPIFSASRIVGWCAHAIEQTNNNTIFRPTAMYVGK